jgi:general secretion pathway protein F
MAVFEYKGLNAKGKAVSGVLDSENPRTLKMNLRKEGIFLTEYAQTDKAGGRKAVVKGTLKTAGSKDVELGKMLQRVKLMDVAIVTRQLATLIKAGIPVVDSLSATIDQTENPKLKSALTGIRQQVNEGSSLANALAQYPKIFSDMFVNMVRAGESSGTLDIVFIRLADFIESQVKLRTKLMGTMMYPVIMLVVGFAIVSLMMVFVIPKITEMFTELGSELPWQTKMLIGASDLFRSYWYLVFATIGGVIWYFNKWRQQEKGREKWDAFRLRVPVFGELQRMIAITRFSKTFGTLLSSGVSLLVALDIVKSVMNNVVLSKVIDDARTGIREGESIAGPLKRSNQFPPMVTHMIAIGEKSGQLEEMLNNVSSAYEAQVDSKVSQLTAVLEPIMLVLMGIGVAFLVFAILMPMLQMNQAITGGG